MNETLREYLIAAAAMFGLTALQLVVAGMLSVGSIEPDFVVLGIVFIAVRYGRIPGMFYGFASGLFGDLYAGEIIGISALALTVAAFVTGSFHDPENPARQVRSYRLIGIVFLGSLVRNLVSVFAYFQSFDFDLVAVFGQQVLLAAVYTTLVATIPVLVLVRTGNRLRV